MGSFNRIRRENFNVVINWHRDDVIFECHERQLKERKMSLMEDGRKRRGSEKAPDNNKRRTWKICKTHRHKRLMVRCVPKKNSISFMFADISSSCGMLCHHLMWLWKRKKRQRNFRFFSLPSVWRKLECYLEFLIS